MNIEEGDGSFAEVQRCILYDFFLGFMSRAKKKKNSTYFLDIVHYILEARILRIYEYKEKWETMVNIWLIQAKNICLTCFFNDGLIMGNKHPLN